MYDVIALGELLVDLAERTKDENGYPTLAANPGGAPGNFLAALSTYGKKTAFLAKVGDDTFGHLLTGTMRRAGIFIFPTPNVLYSCWMRPKPEKPSLCV